jgi:hypothetical protein
MLLQAASFKNINKNDIPFFNNLETFTVSRIENISISFLGALSQLSSPFLFWKLLGGEAWRGFVDYLEAPKWEMVRIRWQPNIICLIIGEAWVAPGSTPTFFVVATIL